MRNKHPELIFKDATVAGPATPYYVPLENVRNSKRQDIKKIVDTGRYFSIFAPRQSGKATFVVLLFFLAILAKTGFSQSANDTTYFDLNEKITETRNKLDSLQNKLNKTLNKYNNARTMVEVTKKEIAVAAKEVKAANKDMQIAHDVLKEAQTRQRNNYKISVEKERLQCLKASEECKKAVALVQNKERGLVKAKGKVQKIYTILEGIQREYNTLVEGLFQPEAKKHIKPKKLYLPGPSKIKDGPTKKDLIIKNDGLVPLGPRLRSKCTEFYRQDAIEMIEKHNFYDSYKNKTGDFKNKFVPKVINGNEVVIDDETKLMWHQSGTRKMKWKKTKGWVDNLNEKKYAGYGDWRLPTLEEAASLLERVEGATNLKELKGKLNKEGKKYKLFIDPVFSNIQKSIWTCDGPKSNQVFIVCFDLGLSGKCNLNEYSYVRPVRSVK